MVKIKLSMDNDNDFILIEAEVCAFGWDAKLRFSVSQGGSRRVQSQLPMPDVIDLTEEDFEEVVLLPDDYEDSA